ncbi:hypothetical protein DdX_18311 [Ditylenchus destructor]|uniref:Uncharacterized protein n=1 Tax=Ditylenchus destructor TaxID=166010 RepID=A0AAD4QSX2_9BILA|nr:hypothetical protein DdX_18311 [Ditylenchus destructor]
MTFPEETPISAGGHFIGSQLPQSQKRRAIATAPATAQQNLDYSLPSISTSASSSASRSRHTSQSSNQYATLSSQFSAMFLPVLVVLVSLLSVSNGLACYETVDGNTVVIKNDAWTYCALVPAMMHGNEYREGTQFGLGRENDFTPAYDAAFSVSAAEYGILTVCQYERYDFSRFLPMRPDIAIEYSFRCVCNYDLCNSEPTFSAFLGGLKAESFAAKKKK